MGTRVKKSVGSTHTYYIGDHFEIQGGTTVKYIFAGNLRVAQVKGGETSYFHKDHLGSSTVMTNASGYEIETTEYMPFGSQRNHSGTNTSAYKFTDQELDAENGLYNYNARLYDPIIGRFISPDTIVQAPYNPQSLNRYSYCLNNPLIYTDPSGHEMPEYTLDEIVVSGKRIELMDFIPSNPLCLWNQINGDIPPWVERIKIELQMQIESMIASLPRDVSKLNISDKGVAFIADYEKFKKDVYICSGGKETIGYGHVVKAGEDWSNGIGKTEALALLKQDLQTAVIDVQTVLSGTQMTQNEFDATVALVVNIGRPKFDEYSVSDKIAAGKSIAIVESAWRSIRKAGGVDNLGIMRRRYDETQIYFHNTYARTYHSKDYLYNH